MDIMALVPTVAVLVLLTAAAVYALRPRPDINLKNRYEECLKGTDKKAALEAGRAYRRSLRKNHILTVYDEMAIANDLSVME